MLTLAESRKSQIFQKEVDEKGVKISNQSINQKKKVTANTRILLLTNETPKLPDM